MSDAILSSVSRDFLSESNSTLVVRASSASTRCMTPTERILGILERLDRSQAWLADKAGLDATMISRVLNGKQRLYFDQAVSICLALDISLDELAGLEPKAQQRTPEESKILGMIELLGYERATKRLMREEGAVFGPPSTEVQVAARTGTK